MLDRGGLLRIATAMLVCLVVLASASLLFGQGGANGTISGTVIDNGGAVLSKADVDVINVATGVATHVETNSTGDYTAPFLNPGTYRITVQAPGFQKSVVDNVGLAVAQQARVDVTMKAGSVTEIIEVTANAIALDTENAAIGQSISNRQVTELPLNGRSFLGLIFIGGGAVQTNGEQGSMRQGLGDAISINGARPTSNNYMLDGLVNTDTALNTPALLPSIDALQEFKEQSSTYSAEYGFSANQINIATKSGTNDVHGTAFWFGRNDALDAIMPLTRTPGVPVDKNATKLRQNQFGFVAGGPLYIPKLYNGRNKTFWLANYEGTRIRRGSVYKDRVPDPAQLGGNFSAANLPAFDLTPGSPCQLALQANQPCMPIDPQTGNPFPGNVIPTSRFSRLASVFTASGLIPAPNCLTATCITTGQTYQKGVPIPTDISQQTYRLDQVLGRYGTFFGRFTKMHYTSASQGSLSGKFGDSFFLEDSTSWGVSHTIPLGQNMVNSFRFGRLEPIANQLGVDAPQSDINKLGLTGIFTKIPSGQNTYPSVTVDNNIGRIGSANNGITLSYVPMWEFADSLTINKGKHSFSTGFDYRNWIQARNLAGGYNGGFGFRNDLILANGSATGFNGFPTNNCPTTTCGTGNSLADFLLGYYRDGSAFQPGPFTVPGTVGNLNKYHFLYFAPYFQDDWKATQRLTLNIGLRWDFRTVPYEQSNKMGWLDVTNPLGGLCVADQKLVAQGITGSFYRNCGRRNPADGSKKPFAPRIGLAWRPFGEKTVFRAGYGIFFDSSEGREIDDSGDIYPYLNRTSRNPTTQAIAPKLTDNLFPPADVLHQASPITDGNFFAVIISEKPRNPYVQQWSFSVQRQLDRSTTLEADYLGTEGTHLLTRNDVAQALPPSNPALCQTNPTAGDCPVSGRRPYPNFTGEFIDSRWGGYSNYNAGSIKLERRNATMAITANYTWSKSLDDKSAAAGIGDAAVGWDGFMNNHAPQLDYARSDFDVGQRFVSSFVYQLPVGRGKRFGNGMNRAADTAIGGWQLGGIVTFQGGFPFSIYAGDPGGLLNTIFGNGNRANLVGSYPSGFKKTRNEWFDTAAFVQPPAAVYGNTSRNFLRAPGSKDFDLNLSKTMKVSERIGVQLRLEAFNAFNNTHLGKPGNNVNNGGFGVITSAGTAREVQLGGKIIF